MKHRHLGSSGLRVSEITYGNWLTHGEQVERDAALACVRSTLDVESPHSTPPTCTRSAPPRICSTTWYVRARLYLGVDGGDGLRSRIVSNQPQYNMLWRVIEPEVVPLCEKAGIGQIVFQPLAQAVLTGRYLPGKPPPPDSRAAGGGRAPNFIRGVLGDQLLSRVQQVREVTGVLSIAQFAIAWMRRVDEVLGDLVSTDPGKTARMMDVKPSWVS